MWTVNNSQLQDARSCDNPVGVEKCGVCIFGGSLVPAAAAIA